MSDPLSVLIIVRDFLPYYPSLGVVIRTLKLAEFLQQRGVGVHVLAAKGHPVSYFGYEDTVRRLQVTYLDDYLQRQVTGGRGGDKRPAGSKGPSPFGRRLTTLRQFLMREMLIPDLGAHLTGKFVARAAALIREHNIRNVIVSSPPHSTQLIGLQLKRRLGDRIRWIADYRDSWNLTGIFRKRNPLARALSERLERQVLAAADHFTYHSAPVLEKINRHYFDVSAKATLVANGFDLDMWAPGSRAAPDNPQLTLGYFGALDDRPNSIRHPGRLLAAVAKSPRPIKLCLFGAVDISPEWRHALGARLVLGGSLAHAEALGKMAEMDLLLVLHSQRIGADEVIPAKMYEYMLTGRPLLVAGPRDMECARIVRRDGLGYCADLYAEGELDAVLEQAYSDWTSGQLPAYASDTVARHSRQGQYSKMLELLE